MTRKWIRLQAKGDEDKSEVIDAILDRLTELRVRDAFREAAEQDGLFGRSHLYIDTGQSEDKPELQTPIGSGRDNITRTKVAKGSLKRVKPIEAVWVYPTTYNTSNPLAPDWYRPQTWLVNGTEVHSSRLLTFIGRDVPDLLKPAYSFGGLSLSQMARPYIDNWLRIRQSVADLISSFSLTGIKTNLAEKLATDKEGLKNRIAYLIGTKDNRNVVAIDKELEDFFNISTPLGTLDTLQSSTQQHMSAVCGIPLVKLLGVTPSGLNASSDGEIRCFYDWVHAYQEVLFRPNLTRVIDFVQMDLFGAVDPDIHFEFEPLWALDEKEQADVDAVRANTDVTLVENGILLAKEARQRIANDPDTVYAGLNVDDLPDMPEPSEMLPEEPVPVQPEEQDADPEFRQAAE